MRKDYWVKATQSGYAIYERWDGKTRVIDRAVDPEQARLKIRALRGPVDTKVYAERNLDLLNRYWAKEYSRRKTSQASKESMRGAFDRLLLALGGLEIEASRIEDLQTAVDKMSDQRRGAMCLNILRKFVGLSERAYLNKPGVFDVQHVSLPQLQGIEFSDSIERALAYTAFGTGGRQGELFNLTIANLLNDKTVIRIHRQRYRSWALGNPKRGQVRHAPVIPECLPFIEEWLAVPEDTKKAYRNTKYLESHSWNVFRHSYAIHLLKAGFSLESVAKSLGNSIVVCEKHYGGYVMDAGSAAHLAKRLKKD